MEKFAFKEFMNKEVVQKTIIFADAYNLYIDGWQPANTEEHPYRINFFSRGLFVGYIEGQTYAHFIDSLQSDMSFVLYTPIGKIEGNYSTYYNLFSYNIENRKDSFEKIDGLFKIEGLDYLEQSREYNISSHLTFTNLNKENIRISFNRRASNYEVEIVKYNNSSEETIRLYINSEYLKIEHFVYPERNKKIDFTNIVIEFGSKFVMPKASFSFLGKESYQKKLEIGKNEFGIYSMWWQKLEQIKYSEISQEIEANDSRMLTFIEEIRQELTLLANGITPINIYDKIARLCFFKKSDKFKLDFSRAEQTNTALNYNPVLKRMRKNQQDRRTN